MAGFVTEFLHRFKFLRDLAKKLYKNKTIRQPFYTGFIYFNAVDYSFLWTNSATADHHDREIQDALVRLSQGKEMFIDIGSNIGIMTLAVALRNPKIFVKAYDPNNKVLDYLRKSLESSGIKNNVEIINAAVSDFEGTAYMNFSKGSYAGHLSDKGTAVPVLNFETILEQTRLQKTLFKMDIEGFEKFLIPLLVKEKNPNHVYVIEMHPPGLNNVSDPDKSFACLFDNGFTVLSASGEPVKARADIKSWDNIVCFYEK